MQKRTILIAYNSSIGFGRIFVETTEPITRKWIESIEVEIAVLIGQTVGILSYQILESAE